MLNLVFVFALSVAYGMDMPAPSNTSACEALLQSAPQADMLWDFRREDLPRYEAAFRHLNSVLPPDRRLSSEQLNHALLQAALGTEGELVQLREIFEYDFVTGDAVVPEYLEPLHAWLLELATTPLPAREDLARRQQSYSRSRPPLNPFQQRRLPALRDAYARLEAKLGQPLYDDAEFHLDYYARSESGYREILERWSRIPEGTREYNVREYVDKLGLVRRYLLETRGAPMGLSWDDVVIAMLDQKTVRNELDHYVRALQGGTFQGAEYLANRVVGWMKGEATPIETTFRMVGDEVVEAIRIFAQGGPGPHYMGPLLTYSLYAHFRRERLWEREEELKSLLSALDQPNVNVISLGQLAMTKAYLGRGASQETLTAFAVTVEAGPHTYRIAVSAVVKGYQVEIENMRLTLFEPRLQDVFDTTPLDLREPLVSLYAYEGGRSLLPAKILISTLALTPREQLEQSEPEQMKTFARRLQSSLMQEPSLPKRFAEIRLMGDGIAGQPMVIPLTEERTGAQIYEHTFQTSLLTLTRIRLKRNLMNDSYELDVQPQIGLWKLWLKAPVQRGRYRSSR